MSFKIKRIYEAGRESDGARVLVDRLWPRGVKKEVAKVDVWMKDVAPSPTLRIWFGHEKKRFPEFKRRYLAELRINPALAELRALGKGAVVTLLYAARDPEVNHAIVLLRKLQTRPRIKARTGVRHSSRPH